MAAGQCDQVVRVLTEVKAAGIRCYTLSNMEPRAFAIVRGFGHEAQPNASHGTSLFVPHQAEDQKRCGRATHYERVTCIARGGQSPR